MSEWIPVCGEEGGAPIEICAEDDGTLLLTSITDHFPGTTTLKYRSKETNAFRGVKCQDGVLTPPSKEYGWEASKLYICVNPDKKEDTSNKRKLDQEEYSPAKQQRNHIDAWESQYEMKKNPDSCTDLVLLGLSPGCTELTVRSYFEKYGDLVMVQLKKSKDSAVGYGFIKFKEKSVEKLMLKQKHEIEGRLCTLRIPDSQNGDKAHRKVYISYHSQEVTVDDLREHFEKYGDIVDVYVSNPWRHFAFVTFADRRVAESLLGKEHHIREHSLYIKSAVQTGKHKKEDNDDPDGGFSEDTSREAEINRQSSGGGGPGGYTGYGYGYGYGPNGLMPPGAGPYGPMHPGMMPGGMAPNGAGGYPNMGPNGSYGPYPGSQAGPTPPGVSPYSSGGNSSSQSSNGRGGDNGGYSDRKSSAGYGNYGYGYGQGSYRPPLPRTSYPSKD